MFAHMANAELLQPFGLRLGAVSVVHVAAYGLLSALTGCLACAGPMARPLPKV